MGLCDFAQEMFKLDWLGQVIKGAGFDSVDAVLGGGMSGQQNDFGAGCFSLI